MNVRLLRRIQKHILEEPRRLVMSLWGGRHQDLLRSVNPPSDLSPVKPPCGTVGCIAGWACQLSTKSPKKELGFDSDGSLRSFKDEPIFVGAAELLDLDMNAADRLFMFSRASYRHWPREFEDRYARAKTPRGRARVVARRIDHFIKTEGRE